jgi:hypothetical protein
MKTWNKHGDSVETGDRRLYRLYSKIKARSFNPNQAGYHLYGGRGVVMCDGWKNNYKRFRKWAYSNGYKDGLSIDRIDNDKGYFPQNCRWITPSDQHLNRRNTIKHGGVCAKHASERLGGSKNLVSNRLKLGWNKEDAFSTASRGRIDDKTKLKIKVMLDKGMKQTEIASAFGLKQSTISKLKTRLWSSA